LAFFQDNVTLTEASSSMIHLIIFDRNESAFISLPLLSLYQVEMSIVAHPNMMKHFHIQTPMSIYPSSIQSSSDLDGADTVNLNRELKSVSQTKCIVWACTRRHCSLCS
jgi:hypothetical protein